MFSYVVTLVETLFVAFLGSAEYDTTNDGGGGMDPVG